MILTPHKSRSFYLFLNISIPIYINRETTPGICNNKKADFGLIFFGQRSVGLYSAVNNVKIYLSYFAYLLIIGEIYGKSQALSL